MDAAPATTTEPIQKEHCAENPASRILITLEKSKQPISPDEVRRTISRIKGLLKTLEQQLLALEK